jgi:acetolactate decarboxylase
MKKMVLGIVLFVVFASGCVQQSVDQDVIFQQSTIDALLAANYQTALDFKTLKKHGDFGIGTFNDLDGEMLALNGEFYQIKSDGKVYPVKDEMRTPFASITFFAADNTVQVFGIPEYAELEAKIDALLPTENIFYAIKLEGTFDRIKVRSVPRQKKPYQPLVEVVKSQPVYELENVQGTLVGFKCPAYVKGINVPGYHFHFIDQDKKQGGHLLDCAIKEATLEIDYTHGFAMNLPGNKTFYQTDLKKDKAKELEKVEK